MRLLPRLSSSLVGAALLCSASSLTGQTCTITEPDCYTSSSEPPEVIVGAAAPTSAQQVEILIFYSDDMALSGVPQVSISGGTILDDRFSYSDAAQRSAMSTLLVQLGSSTTITAQIGDNVGQTGSDSRTFSYTAPPSPPTYADPIVSAAVQNGVNRNLATCEGCSEAVLTHSTPAYVSLDQPRGVTLFYSSNQAAPRAFVQLDVTDPSGQPADYFSVRLQTTSGSYVTFPSGSTYWYFQRGTGTEANRLAVQFDAQSYSTGSYAFTAEVTSHWSNGTTKSRSQVVRVPVINEKNSELGAGWTIAGLQRLYSMSDGVVITSGDGSISFFSRTCSGTCTYASPPGDFSTLEEVPTGGLPSYRRHYPDGSSVRFDAMHRRMTSAVDRYGNTTQFSYDGLGNLLTIADPAGTVIQLGYSNGRISTITDPISRVTSFTYSGSPARLDTIRNPGGALALTMTYDAQARLTTWRDVRRSPWEVYYGFASRVDSILAPPVQTAAGSQRPVIRVRSLENRVLVSASVGNLASKRPVVPLDSAHVLTTSPTGAQERVWVDGFGSATRIVNAEGRVWRFTRNHHGLVEFARDADGNATWSTYGHGDHRVTGATTSTAGGLVQSQIEYGAFSLPTRMTTEGIETNYVYHANGALDSIYIDTIWSMRYTTDSRGRVLSVRDRAGNASSFEYLSSGSLNTHRIISPEGRTQTFGYDAAGRTTSVTVPGNLTTIRAYDAFNRVTSTTQPGSITTTLFYSGSRPEPDSVRDARGKRRRFQYNGLGWVTTETNPMGQALSYQYDVDGNVTTWTDAAGRNVSATYDSLGRVRTRTAGGSTTTYSYDPNRRWAAVNNPVSTDTVFYHANGQVKGTSSARPGITRFETTYRYNGRGQLDHLQVARAGLETLSVEYSYDAGGRLAGIRDILTQQEFDAYTSPGWGGYSIPARTSTLGYNNRGQIRRVSLGGGSGRARLEFAYTPDGALQSAMASSSHGWIGLLSREYTFHPRGQVASRRIRIPNTLPEEEDLRRFTYDSRGQLTGYGDYDVGQSEVCPDPFDLWSCYWQPYQVIRDSTTFAWDAVGNPSGSGRTVNDANRLTAFDGTQMSYDQAGYMTSRTKPGVLSQTFYWNALGQLDSTTHNVGGTVRYQYDGFGRRVTRIAHNGAITRYVYDGEHVLVETDGIGTLKRAYSYYPGVDNPHSVREFNSSLAGTYYYTQELPGHVTGLVRGDGVVVNRYRYSAFGKAEEVIEGLPNSLRFMAREWDPDARLYYVRNRWYDPEVGRFISEDPIGVEGDINLFRYVGNDPANFTDPFGLQCPNCLEAVHIELSCSWGGWERGEDGVCRASTAYRNGGLAGWWAEHSASNAQAWENYVTEVQYMFYGAPMSREDAEAMANASMAGMGATRSAGQLHHIISTRIGRALQRHPTLTGKYRIRDPRYVTRASSPEAHRGYQSWHRQLDDRVVGWLARHPNISPGAFENYLRRLYMTNGLGSRFPNGF